jgi:hypothetical integral membrane protein (TIGR02206 family)|tara:strand:- start:1094 stop:1810 length:717 start_codon:yes stop_codon:yes gene_type:complete
MDNLFFNKNNHYIIDIQSFEGLLNLTISFIIIVSILVVGKYLNKSTKLALAKVICILAIILTFYGHLIDIFNNNWRLNEDLPLHLCSISNLILCVILFIPKNNKLFEFLFYCGFLGGLMAILTPQINYYDGGIFMYLEYYITHGIIILIPLYMFYHLEMKLSKYSWLSTFLILNVLMLIVMPLNFIIGSGSNYMYLSDSPKINNPLVFGDWPFYILNWEIIVLLLFYFTYLTFTRKKI